MAKPIGRLLALVLVLAITASAQPPRPLVGLGTHSLLDHDLAEMRRLGATRLRHTLYWHLWESDRAYKDWTVRRIGAACDQGFALLIVVDGTPPGGRTGEAAARAYVDLMRSLARRFQCVEAWQILNEKPIHSSGFAAARFHDAVYGVIKAANPNALVISQSMDPTSTWGQAWLRGKPRSDAIAIHVYGWPTADHMRRQVSAALGRGYPVWVTEYGSGRNIIPPEMHRRWEEIQRDELRAATAAAAGAQRAYIYQYQTDEAAQYSAGEWHGIVRPDRTWRPAATWLRQHLRAQAAAGRARTR